MKRTVFIIAYFLSILCSVYGAQVFTTGDRGKDMRIQKLVRDVVGTTITLNFKEHEPVTGTLIRADGTEFIMEVDGATESFPTETIRSYTIKASIAEGFLVLASAGVVGGFGAGASALLFKGLPFSTFRFVAVVFAILGGWIGYDSFFQDIEIALP